MWALHSAPLTHQYKKWSSTRNTQSSVIFLTVTLPVSIGSRQSFSKRNSAGSRLHVITSVKLHLWHETLPIRDLIAPSIIVVSRDPLDRVIYLLLLSSNKSDSTGASTFEWQPSVECWDQRNSAVGSTFIRRITVSPILTHTHAHARARVGNRYHSVFMGRWPILVFRSE